MSNRENTSLEIGPENEGITKIIFSDHRHLKAISTVIFIALAFFFVGLVYVFVNTDTKLAERDKYISSLIEEVGQLKQDVSSAKKVAVLSPKVSTKKIAQSSTGAVAQVTLASEDSNFDVLILGTNGNLTDTIMLASVNESLKKVTIFSIPRDLYINGRRINEYLYYYGMEEFENQLNTITGLDIQKYIKVDLNGFVKVVDILGGLDVYVDQAIYDGLYPNSKGGYSAYSIAVGNYHMDGTDALKYARSRKSTSDFSRAARQQTIVGSVRTKILQMEGTMEMKDLFAILQSAIENVTTDVNILDLISYYYSYKDFELSSGFVLSNQNYLYSLINQSGAYTLLPKTGNFDEIKEVINTLVTH